MAVEPTRDGPEISRRIREELERIRDAEARVEEALETVRQARRRVEVVARELAREEERVRAWVRDELKVVGGPGPASSLEGEATARSWRSDPAVGWSTSRDAAGRPREGLPGPGLEPTMPPVEPAGPVLASTTSASTPPTVVAVEPAGGFAWGPRVGLGLLVAVAIALIGWFAIGGLRKDSVSEAATDSAAARVPAAQATPAAPSSVAPGTGGGDSAVSGSPLAQLPTDAAARQSLYDSLFTARSPLFDPLLAIIQSESGDKGVQRALTDWKSGSVDAQDADLIHSAFLQHILKGEIDPRIEVDGQVLRNPCRGRSCSALLNVWEHQQAKYGLPPVPDNAPTDARALRQAEAVVVLSWLRQANTGAASTGAN